MEIKEATLEDEEQVYIMAKSLATSFDVCRERFSVCFAEVIGSKAYELLIAREGERAVGYVFGLHHPAFHANGTISWVEEVFVEEPERRKGTGRRLLEAFENRARDRGSRLVGLATRRASAFYSAIGYEESAVFFRKLLNEAASCQAPNGHSADAP